MLHTLFGPPLLAAILYTSSSYAASVAGLQKRDDPVAPVDAIGISVDFKCTTLTLPAPGTGDQGGSGGEGEFGDSFTMTLPDGSTIYPVGCEQDNCLGTCFINCEFQSDQLPFGDMTAVSANYDPAGGYCSMNFNYNGIEYDTSSAAPNNQCGETSSFEPFGDTQTAECLL